MLGKDPDIGQTSWAVVPGSSFSTYVPLSHKLLVAQFPHLSISQDGGKEEIRSLFMNGLSYAK